MKVLLINPITSERGMFAATPNLGLGYLATALRRNGFEVDIWDGMKKDMTRKKLDADFACRGEAEIGLPKLLKKLKGEDECSLGDIHHLIWRDGDRMIC